MGKALTLIDGSGRRVDEPRADTQDREALRLEERCILRHDNFLGGLRSTVGCRPRHTQLPDEFRLAALSADDRDLLGGAGA